MDEPARAPASRRGTVSDHRRAAVQARIRSLGGRPDALIEVLHTAQDAYGHLDRQVLAEIGAALGVPLSAVYGVATFYSHFTLRPYGAHTCVVCTGTACHIAGGARILDAVQDLDSGNADSGNADPGNADPEKADPGKATDETSLTVLTTRCPGTCSLAPMVLVDGVALGPVTAGEVRNRLTTLSAGPR
jgi:bidirectional [NiFe] hydrogenase diaphorase subunit